MLNLGSLLNQEEIHFGEIVSREPEALFEAPEAEILIAPIGPVIGAHAGPGVMTVFFWGNNH